MRFSEAALKAGRTLEGIIVSHTNFKQVAEYIEQAVQIGMGTGIFTGARVVAPSGTGKTSLLVHLSQRLQGDAHSNGGIPLISASLKENPSVSQIQGDLLANFNYPLTALSRRTNNNDVNLILLRAIAQHGTRLVALDEFQHLFLSGGTKVASPVIDWAKRLMNAAKVPLLLLGTEMMDRLEGVDPQLTTRIPTVLHLSPFLFNEEWGGFLKSLGATYAPVDLSKIYMTHEVALFRATRGSPRLLKGLLVHAVAIAVTKGESTLTDETLQEAYRMQNGLITDGENPFVVRR